MQQSGLRFAVNAQDFLAQRYEQVWWRYDPEHAVLWSYLDQPKRIPCINLDLLNNLHQHHLDITNSKGQIALDGQMHDIKYSVFASSTPGYFNMGGDLKKMASAIRNQDRESLMYYARLSIDVVAQRAFRFSLPRINTISLLQGEVLGAGIEAALTSDVLIAERQSVFCFPEMFFNMIPGMGAYSFIARKAGMQVADKMIMGCGRFTAEECLEMGLIDMVVDEGQGELAVYEYIKKQSKRSEGFLTAQKAKQMIHPLTYAELEGIVLEWVENALLLTERDLKVMDRFYRAQEKLFQPVNDNMPANVVAIADNKQVASVGKQTDAEEGLVQKVAS